MRRTHLRGHANILKRLLVHTGAVNLGLLMRTLIGVGTPRGLQGRVVAVLTLVVALWTRLIDCWRPFDTPLIDHTSVCPIHAKEGDAAMLLVEPVLART